MAAVDVTGPDASAIVDRLKDILVVCGAPVHAIEDSTRQEIVHLIEALLAEPPFLSQDVLFAGVLSCPWLTAIERQRAEDSENHMKLLVIYKGSDEDFLSPRPSHQLSGVESKNWDSVVVMALRYFVRNYASGSVLAVELPFLTESCRLIVSDAWKRLLSGIDFSSSSLSFPRQVFPKKFFSRCRGQAVDGLLRRKGQTFYLDEAVTCEELCQSVRLLAHLECALRAESLLLDPELESLMPCHGQECLQLVREVRHGRDVAQNKEKFLEKLCEWNQELQDKMRLILLEMDDVIGLKWLGDWAKETRLGSRSLVPLQPDEECRARADDLVNYIITECPRGSLSKFLGPRTHDELILVTRVGSYLYNLHTESSDADYTIIYTAPLDSLLSSLWPGRESMECRGPDLSVEYGCYELRLFAEMLTKGSVSMLELIFSPHMDCENQAFRELRAHADLFVSETAISQYMGLARCNLRRLEEGKPGIAGKESKMVYQILHKLLGVRAMITGNVPPVRLECSLRDHVMRVRTGSLTLDELKDIARNEVNEVSSELKTRTSKLRENCDFTFLVNWIMKTRGWPTS